MSCRHFEVEGLARLERGVPDPHSDECDQCRTARTGYQRLTAALAATGADHQPRPGWEDRVWAAVDRDRGAREVARVRWGWVAGGLVVAAAALVLLVCRPWHDRGGRPGGGDRVAVYEIVKGPTVVRGSGGAVGDSISVRYPAAGAAVWIYQGEQRLRIQCDQRARRGPACRSDGDGVAALVLADAPATYHVLTFTSPAPLAAPATLDEALATLTRARVRIERRHFDFY